MISQNKKYEYFAFISYKREDEKMAKWLQKKLESYSLPIALRKANPELPNRIRPVFRDQSDLSGGNLKSEIEKGLNGSKFLIVVCSPRSAKSKWVSKEVEHFIDQGKEEFIIPFIIGGMPNASNPEDECFPEGLRQLTDEKELLGININEMGRDAAAMKVIARMFDLRFDTLWQRHEKEKRKKIFLFGLLSALIVISAISATAYIAKQNAKLSSANDKILKERDRANQERNRAEVANRNLTIAYDSLSIVNNALAATIRDLDSERRNVVLKSTELQKEQLRLISKQAEALFDEGNVLRSYQLIRPMALDIINRNYPYSPEIASLINKIKWHLNKNGYKVIEQLVTSQNDSTYVSQDLIYNPYVEQGKFYLRNVMQGTTIVLPGEDVTDDCDFQFGRDIIYYRGIYNSFMWDLKKKEKIKSTISISSYPEGYKAYEYFMSYTIPDIIYPVTKYIHSYEDIPDIIDYRIKEIVENDSVYICSPDGKEILVRNKLLSKRVLPISLDSGHIYSSIYAEKKSIADSIVYKGLTWHIIDKKGPLSLYQWSEYDDATNLRLLLKNDLSHSDIEFTPFVAYSTGNGIGYLETAFILNEEEVLCVSGQTNHQIYNTKLNTRKDFQYGTIDGWKMAHAGLYLANAFLLDENTLCDVRNNGQITIYDIPSRLVIDEYDIPLGGWLRNWKWIEQAFRKGNNIIMAYEDCSYKVPLAGKLQSLSEDIFLIDQFWK